MSNFDRLDEIAIQAAKGDLGAVGPLSTGERLYVGLASNNIDLLERDGYTIAEALARLGEEWTVQLIERWQYRGNPKNFASST